MDIHTRAYGALLGLYVGEGFASQTDGLTEDELETIDLDQLDQVYSLEHLRPSCGMSGEISDVGSILALSILFTERLDTDHLRSQILRYGKEDGNQLSALLEQSLQENQTEKELTRLLPLSLLLALATFEAAEKHIQTICKRFCACFSADSTTQQALILLIMTFRILLIEKTRDSTVLLRLLSERTRRMGLDQNIIQAVRQTNKEQTRRGIVATLEAVFSLLNEGASYTQGVITLAKRGNDSRLTCALFGALKAAMDGPDVLEDLWVDEVFPSPALEAMVKYQTLYKRETITMDKLATLFSKRLLDLSIS